MLQSSELRRRRSAARWRRLRASALTRACSSEVVSSVRSIPSAVSATPPRGSGIVTTVAPLANNSLWAGCGENRSGDGYPRTGMPDPEILRPTGAARGRVHSRSAPTASQLWWGCLTVTPATRLSAAERRSVEDAVQETGWLLSPLVTARSERPAKKSVVVAAG